MKIILATTNRGKITELRELLAGEPIEFVSIADATREPFEVVEDGATFEANAIKKARAASALTGLVALADDSGLEVDALGGMPGVRSARFAGEHASDAENIAALVAIMRKRNLVMSPARFRCAIALVDPSASEPVVVEASCEGSVIVTPRGENGFGYDPLFVVSGKDRTMAELTAAEKNAVSHRARALAKMRVALIERASLPRV
ncbi:MAG: RdgB/HAM1 family non-canonical purine NTP pyrophosphatase [Polyangiaceae bacterium]